MLTFAGTGAARCTIHCSRNKDPAATRAAAGFRIPIVHRQRADMATTGTLSRRQADRDRSAPRARPHIRALPARPCAGAAPDRQPPRPTPAPPSGHKPVRQAPLRRTHAAPTHGSAAGCIRPALPGSAPGDHLNH